MASLAQAIHSFQSGGLSHNEFLAQIDRALATDESSTVRLMELLSDEHTRVQLPPDVYAELRRRLEHLISARQRTGADETRMQTMPSGRFSSQPASWGNGANEQYTVAPDRMKGVGDTLNGRFVLEECIGFGGMGMVYKALDLRKLEASDRKPYIAIKVLNVQFRGHPKSLITLQREARKAQTLAHPNIVAVYDFDRDGSTVYLTMEYLSGKSLSQTLRTPGFAGMPYAEAMRIVNGMGKALAYAHERGFVHCDFKPANVIITDKGDVKVIDFGIARVFRKPEEDTEATVFDPGSLGGLTPAYASPELLEHLEPDPRDDVYALACITYELLTGKHPFDRYPATQARAAGMKLQRPKNLGIRQWRALKCALAFERNTRTPSVTRFLQEMSGQSRMMSYAVTGGAVVAAAALLATTFNYFYRESRVEQAEEPRATAAPAPAPVSPEPPVARPSPTPAPTPAPAPEPALTLSAVAPVLARVPCSALMPAVQEHALQVRGYLPASLGLSRFKEMLNAIPGVKTLNVDVVQVNDDKCGVINAFAPYWTRSRQAGMAASIRTRPANAELTEGDPLIVDITTPGYDSHVYVDYYVLDGNVVHLVPNPRAKANQAPPHYTAAIGSLGNWVISKPFGNELIVLVAAPAPLFDTIRPESESGADYLRAVEKQLGQMARKYGQERIAVDFVQITTKARK
jgi:serine/threonine protein kinase